MRHERFLHLSHEYSCRIFAQTVFWILEVSGEKKFCMLLKDLQQDN